MFGPKQIKFMFSFKLLLFFLQKTKIDLDASKLFYLFFPLLVRNCWEQLGLAIAKKTSAFCYLQTFNMK